MRPERLERRFDRRAFLGLSAGALALGLAAPLRAAGGPILQASFINKLPDYTTQSFRDWYEMRHAPDFLSFARPHLMRYARNFVTGSREPNPGIDVISEFGFRSAEAQAEVLRLMTTPAADRLKAPPRAIEKSLAVAIDERVLLGSPRGYDPAGTRKLAVLLRRQNDLPPEMVGAHAGALAGAIAKRLGKDATRILLNVALPNQPAPPAYDGMITIWPAGKAMVPEVIAAPPDLEIVNVLELECFETDLGGGKA
jgi:hypothetical protein